MFMGDGFEFMGGQPSFRAQTRNLWKIDIELIQTLKQVQGDSSEFMGDGSAFRVTVQSSGGRFRVHGGRFRPLHAGVFFHFR